MDINGMRKQDIAALDYIISEKADEIDQLKLAEVGKWISQVAVLDESAPTFRYFGEVLTSYIVELVLEDLGSSALLENLDEKELFYIDDLDRTYSIVEYVTFKDDVNISQKLLKPIAFKNATFNGKVNINATNIPKGVFIKALFKKDVTISDGCKSLDAKCFQADFINNAKLYIPETVESINYQAFAEDYHTKNSIRFGGTVEQFNELTIKADDSISTPLGETGTWPDFVVCSDGTWYY